MTDQQARNILKQYTAWVQLARGNGRNVTSFRYTWALTCAILALESRIPRRTTTKGIIFQSRYCPMCRGRVKKEQKYCHSCGQAIQEQYCVPLSTTPPPPPRPCSNGIIFDELHGWKKGDAYHD